MMMVTTVHGDMVTTTRWVDGRSIDSLLAIYHVARNAIPHIFAKQHLGSVFSAHLKCFFEKFPEFDASTMRNIVQSGCLPVWLLNNGEHNAS
jgi:hypothetical protein